MSDDLQKHWFGLPVPEGVKPVRAWGARAILGNERVVKRVKRKGRTVGRDYDTKVTIDMVGDRSQYRGPDITAPEAKAFFKWIDKTGLPELRKAADEAGLTPDEDRPITVGKTGDGPKYTLVANPRKSYGYLYIVAWEG
jgi:hypothetical protein